MIDLEERKLGLVDGGAGAVAVRHVGDYGAEVGVGPGGPEEGDGLAGGDGDRGCAGGGGFVADDV